MTANGEFNPYVEYRKLVEQMDRLEQRLACIEAFATVFRKDRWRQLLAAILAAGYVNTQADQWRLRIQNAVRDADELLRLTENKG